MGILDDAIREHLELKRQHGAGGEDLRRIEDEAFGPAGEEGSAEGSVGSVALADEAAEAPTEFLQTEPTAPAEPQPDPQEDDPQAEQEAMEHRVPPDPAPALGDDASEEPLEAEEEPPERGTEAEETSEPDVPLSTSELERRAISEQPTELYDVAAELSAGQESPSAEELYEAEAGEPRLVPPEPVGEELEVSDEKESDSIEAGSGEDRSDIGAEAELAIADEEDFFDEQSLSDELDQALDAPDLSMPDVSSPLEPATAEPEPPAPEPEAEPETPAPSTPPEAPSESETPGRDDPFYDPEEEEDVLEETPEFLQDTPEHDRLWFEQKPPKDFDFDD